MEYVGRLKGEELDKLLNIYNKKDIILNDDNSIADLMCAGYIDILNNVDDLIRNGVAIKSMNGEYFPIEYKVLDIMYSIKDGDKKQMQY